MVLRRRGETANRPENIGDALQTLASEMVDVAIVLQTSLFVVNSPQIAASALEKRLPTVYGYREHVITGGLVSYGVDLRWCYRRAAYFVTKILRGTAPSDLPIEFPNWLLASSQFADREVPRASSSRRHFWPAPTK
jgi:putative ABC transport system substrate-binding protein